MSTKRYFVLAYFAGILLLSIVSWLSRPADANNSQIHSSGESEFQAVVRTQTNQRFSSTTKDNLVNSGVLNNESREDLIQLVEQTIEKQLLDQKVAYDYEYWVGHEKQGWVEVDFWFIRKDGQPVGMQPILILARHLDDGSWKLFPPWQQDYQKAVEQVPETVVSGAIKSTLSYTPRRQTVDTADTGGFLFAWSGTASLSQNIAGDGDGFRSHFGNEIDIESSSGSNLDVLAPKDGIVLYMDDSSSDDNWGGCSTMAAATNYIVLGHGPQNESNGEYEQYTLYYHLAHDSIPDDIVEDGRVRTGQRIATAGRTGYVTGVHLHMSLSDEPVTWNNDAQAIDCDGNVVFSARDYPSISSNNSIAIGFEENQNQWPLLGGSTATGVLPDSWNYSIRNDNECDPEQIVDNNSIILYEHRDYGGRCETLSTGTIPDLTGRYVGDGTTSIIANPFLSVWLYDEIDYNGNLLVLDGNQADLAEHRDGNWNDRIKSSDIISACRVPPDGNFVSASEDMERTSCSDPTPTPTPTSTPTPTPTPEPPNCDTSVPGVTIFTEQNYEGACSHLTSDHPDLGQLDVGDNAVSSIYINGEYQVRLYEFTNYGGRYEEVNSSDPNLDIRSLGEQYSSIQIKAQVDCDDESADGVFLYSDKDYEGACIRILTNVSDLGTTAVGDDDVSSVRINGDYHLTLFEDTDYQGRSDEVSGDESNLNTRSLGEQYSSARVETPVYCNDTSQPGIYLYSETNYQGNCAYITGDVGDLDTTPVGNDDPRSLRIVGNFYVRMYEDRWFGGRVDEFGENQDDLTWRSLGDQYSSIKVFVSNTPPNPPSPLYPADTAEFEFGHVPELCWQNNGDPDGDSLLFQVRLRRNTNSWFSTWQTSTCWTPPTSEAGTYAWEIKAKDTKSEESDWSTSYTYTIKPLPLQVTEDLHLSTDQPGVGEVVTASFKVRNISDEELSLQRLGVAAKGPNCASWNCPRISDWPWQENLILQPDEAYDFTKVRPFQQAGDYFSQISFQTADGYWRNVETQRNYVVESGIEVTDPLVITPSEPLIGEIVTAQYALKNAGDHSITLRWVGVVAKGPNCTDWTCENWADFPAEEYITIKPGERYIYRGQRAFRRGGIGYFADPAYGIHNGWWYKTPGGERVNFTVTPGLSLDKNLSLSDRSPVSGEAITASFSVKNVSGRRLSLRRLGVAAKGPNCTAWDCPHSVDWPWHENITLEPGEVFDFSELRSFQEPDGDYFGQILYQYTDNDWNHEGSVRDFSVSSGIKVVAPLTLSPTNPLVGQLVTAQYMVQNTSDRELDVRWLGAVAKGPNCSDWTCDNWADFPADEYITILPGESYTYERQRTFTNAGAGYFVDPAYGDPNGWWYKIPGGERMTFSVSNSLLVVDDLSLSTTEPIVGEEVTATFAVKNSSGQVLSLRRLGVAAKGPNCSAWDCPRSVDWAWEENITLQPDEVYSFSRSRSFQEEGGGYFAQILFQYTDDDWNHLGSEQSFTTHPGLEVIEPLVLSPTTPTVAETVTAEYTVKNSGSKPLTLRWLGVVARGPSCSEWTRDNSVDFPGQENVQLLPGEEYTYVGSRSFQQSGSGYFAEAAYGNSDGWWHSIPADNRRSFRVTGYSHRTYLPVTIR